MNEIGMNESLKFNPLERMKFEWMKVKLSKVQTSSVTNYMKIDKIRNASIQIAMKVTFIDHESS